ncbi:MAG: DUF4230 domain-containing protein [Prevotella sp.]|jgi:hypothetical protein
MKTKWLIFLVIGIVTSFMTEACGGKSEKTTAEERTDTLPMMVMQIQKCSKLYTSEYHIHKIVSYKDTASLSGSLFNHTFKVDLPGGQRRIAIPVDATVKASVDFSKFSEDNVVRNGDKINIILPDPELTLTSTRVDHKGVKEKVSLLRRRFSDEEITRIQKQGRTDIVKAIPQLDIIENARMNAARQIVPIVVAMGYDEKNITVTFRKKYELKDFPSLIKFTD